MTHHFELAHLGSRSSYRAAVRDGRSAPFIDGRQRLGETIPTQLLGVDGYAALSQSQLIRLSHEPGSEWFPDLRGRQVQLLKELCLRAKCSEEFCLRISRDQWIRTTVRCRNRPDANALFSSELLLERQSLSALISSIAIHSNVVPWHPYWPKLRAMRSEAKTRVYFPSTILEVALLKQKSLLEMLNEWDLEDDGDDDDDVTTGETRLCPAWKSFWDIGPDDVEVVREIGVGAEARVLNISWRGGSFASKVFFDKRAYTRELQVVERVSHPHIVYSFGVSLYTDETSSTPHRGTPCHCLLMELLDRNLFELIEDRIRLNGYSAPPFALPDAVHILQQVATAMAYAHHELAEPVIHGDLKPENILVSACEILGDVCPYLVKVADFGRAQILTPDATFKPPGGTTLYAAPELLMARSRKNPVIACPQAIDIYSFGIIAFQVLTGREPYEGLPCTTAEIKEGVVAGTLRPPLREFACSGPQFQSEFSSDLILLVESCWHPDPSARPPFKEVADRLESILLQTNGPVVNPRANAVPLNDTRIINGSDVRPQPQANDAPLDDHVPQVCLQTVGDEPKRPSRMRLNVSRRIIRLICMSPGKTTE